MQAALARPLDPGRHQRRADAAPAPLARDRHPDLGEPEPARIEVDRADDLRSRHGDERPFEVPGRGAGLDVHGRLRCDPVALLRDRSEDERHRETVVLDRGANVERLGSVTGRRPPSTRS